MTPDSCIILLLVLDDVFNCSGAEGASLNTLFEAAGEISAFMLERGWSFCVIGGLAVQQWGEPRTTLDAALTLLAEWGQEAPYVEALLDRFESRIADAREFALVHRVLLLRASNGKDVDVALGALPFEVEMMRRAQEMEFAPGLTLPCCTAEDLFVMKAFAGRERDWLDAESIVRRQARLDESYVLGHLRDLFELKDAPESLARAVRLLKENA
ncbi:MAG: hypothetical protein RBU21_15300 [FCB group bacterium]|jgi:hypothetical protein|nr:hypothetical protein [FCB group bacterium]